MGTIAHQHIGSQTVIRIGSNVRVERLDGTLNAGGDSSRLGLSLWSWSSSCNQGIQLAFGPSLRRQS